MLRIGEEEYQNVVLKCGQRLMKKRFYSSLLKYVAPLLKASIDRSPDCNLGVVASYEYLVHVSGYYVAIERDDLLHNNNTAKECIEHLHSICNAMITLFSKDEEFYHIIFNGTVHLYTACIELFQRRHYKEVALFLGFAVQSCSATILAQTKYFPWRCRIFLSLALAYDMMGDPDSGELVVTKGMSELTELFELESSDTVAPPVSTIEILQGCALQLQTLICRYALVKKASAQVLTSESIASTVSSTLVGLNLNDKDKQALSPSPSQITIIESLITSATTDEKDVSGTLAIPAESMGALLRHIDNLLSEPLSGETESEQIVAEATPCETLVSFVAACHETRESELLEKWVAKIDQIFNQSPMQTAVQQEFNIYKAVMSANNAPESLVAVREALQAACENPDFVAGQKSLLEQVAVMAYQYLTQNGDTEIIRKLSDDAFITIEILATVLIKCRAFDVVMTAQMVALLSKWALRNDTKAAITRTLSVVHHMLLLLSHRRDQFERNTSLKSHSDSLFYATVAAQQAQLIAYDVKLQMQLGIHQLYRRQIRSQKKRMEILVKRKEQSHIFGELSAKEQEILRHEECSKVEVPTINEETQQRLLTERSNSPGELAIALTVIATFCRQSQQQSILLKAKEQILLQTDTNPPLPIDMQWSLLTEAAMKCKCYDLVFESVSVLKQKYLKQAGIDHPAEEIWSTSPVVADYIIEDKVIRLPTSVIEAVTGAFVMAADARCMSEITNWDYKDDPEESFDPDRFKMSEIQRSRLRSANLLTAALSLSFASKNSTLVIDCCTKLFNCLIPLIRTKARTVCLLRPLWLMSLILSDLRGVFLNTPSYQFLLVKVLSELFSCLLAAKAGESVSAQVIKIFHTVWNTVKAHPTEQLLYRTSIRGTSKLFTKSGEETTDNAKASAKKGAPPVTQTLNMLPDATPGIEDLMPLEIIELLDFIVFQFPAGAQPLLQLQEQEAWLPMIYATVLSTIHVNPTQSFEDVQQSYKADVMYPKIMTNIIPLIMRDKSQLASCGDLIDSVLQTLTERAAGIRSTEETTIAPLDELLQSISASGSAQPGSVAKGAKPGKGKDAPADDGDPEAQRLRRQELLTKSACITLIKYKRCRTLQDLRIRQATIDVPFRAKLNELRSVVHLNEALGDIKNHRALIEAHQNRPEEDSSQEVPEKSWNSETSCISCLSKSLVLYARMNRWKHVYSAMISMSNCMAIFYPKEELPTVLPVPNCAKPSDPSLQALAGLQPSVANGDGESIMPHSKGVSICRTQIRSALEQVVCFTEQLSEHNLNMHSYINSLDSSCTEAFLSNNDALRDSILAKTTSLRLALTPDGQSALKAQLARPKPNLWFVSLILEPEFNERGSIEEEESNMFLKLVKELTPSESENQVTDADKEEEEETSADTVPTVTVGLITYAVVETIDSLNSLLHSQKKTFRFVTCFPENIYEEATVDLVVNVSCIKKSVCQRRRLQGFKSGCKRFPAR
eukprot:TRINITY_DN8675_c0_g1_i4.p1 TRINITY_DN8675_c0_g1~~TRINITY_DN8675_c0_g1_i4.p1  ORF type:complete len:1480 (+),score=248.66 TRINITY_DN8675_c0_g1_i4:394-4833(+)